MVSSPTLRSAVLIPILALLPAVSLSADYMSPAISPAELETKLGTPQAPLIVDVRKPAEFKIAHVPGAINIPVDQLEKHLDTLQHDNGVLIYCINGARTRQAEPILYTAGIENVYRLEGAFQAWIRLGLDYEKGEGR